MQEVMERGTAEQLAQTRVTQPALLAHSAMVIEALGGVDHVRSAVKVVLGHSVGEYAALYLGGALALEYAARLLELRGLCMQQAAQDAQRQGRTAMAALLAGEGAALWRSAEEKVAAARERFAGLEVSVANVNSPRQVVVSGHAVAVDWTVASLKEDGVVRRSLPLAVSAPFHCAIMRPAASVMDVALGGGRREELPDGEGWAGLVQLADLVRREGDVRDLCQGVVWVPNVDPALRPRSAADVRAALVAAIAKPVLWTQCVSEAARLLGPSSSFFELGTGSTLTSLLAQNAPAATGVAISTAADLAKW